MGKGTSSSTYLTKICQSKGRRIIARIWEGCKKIVGELGGHIVLVGIRDQGAGIRDQGLGIRDQGVREKEEVISEKDRKKLKGEN
jgi:hypothetical protein